MREAGFVKGLFAVGCEAGLEAGRATGRGRAFWMEGRTGGRDGTLGRLAFGRDAFPRDPLATCFPAGRVIGRESGFFAVIREMGFAESFFEGTRAAEP